MKANQLQQLCCSIALTGGMPPSLFQSMSQSMSQTFQAIGALGLTAGVLEEG